MTTQLSTRTEQLPAIAQERGIAPEVWNALKNTIFPGASDETVALATDYCKARKLDPMKKPIHVVKVWDSDARRMVETLWPSIGEVRTTAMRTKQYAGRDATEFGPDITEKLGSVEMTFPQWAQVTVYRIVNGERVPFPGPRVYWKETYASIKDGSPNMMWKKRVYGQIDKCAEAAALRAAFPEELGNDLTADEMDGQRINQNFSDPDTDGEDKPARPKPPAKNKGAAAAKREMKVAEKVEEEAKAEAEDPEVVDDEPEAKKEEPKKAEPKPAEKEPEAEPEPETKPEPKPKEKAKEPEPKKQAKKEPATALEVGQVIQATFAVENVNPKKDKSGNPLLELTILGDGYAGIAYSKDTENELLNSEGVAELKIKGVNTLSGKVLVLIDSASEAVNF